MESRLPKVVADERRIPSRCFACKRDPGRILHWDLRLLVSSIIHHLVLFFKFKVVFREIMLVALFGRVLFLALLSACRNCWRRLLSSGTK